MTEYVFRKFSNFIIFSRYTFILHADRVYLKNHQSALCKLAQVTLQIGLESRIVPVIREPYSSEITNINAINAY